MNLLINNPAIFEGNDLVAFSCLQRLLVRVSMGQHRLWISAESPLDDCAFLEIGVAAMDRQEYTEILTLAVETHEEPPFPCYAVGATNLPFELSVEAAADAAERPLRVLLENARDGVLVRLAARVATGALADALEHGWIELQGVGGSGELLNNIRLQPLGSRVFAVCDSDRVEPNGSPSHTIVCVDTECRERCIPCWILDRRELENYVPDWIWSNLMPSSKHATAPSSSRRAKVTAVYRSIAFYLANNEKHLKQWHSTEAFIQVHEDISKKAERTPAKATSFQLLKEWRALEPGRRHVDDTKARFGKLVAEKAIGDLESVETKYLDNECKAELGALARALEMWL
ncbi:MAG: hypothetical protein U0228_24845 [Myxococcaceae bacterium]